MRIYLQDHSVVPAQYKLLQGCSCTSLDLWLHLLFKASPSKDTMANEEVYHFFASAFFERDEL